MDDLRIRKFNLSDLERILEIESSSFTIDAFSEATFKSWYSRCADLFIVAELDRDIAGYMITRMLPDKGDVISMAVDVPYRRKGIGRALAGFTLEKLKERRLRTVQLEARTANSAAIGFWKSLGFLPVDTIPAFYRDGAEALRMRRTETNASQGSTTPTGSRPGMVTLTEQHCSAVGDAKCSRRSDPLAPFPPWSRLSQT